VKSKAIFTTHPVKKLHYIFQIGSADPALAVQAARVVQDDVAGINLNCGCSKLFSTSGGVGVALLSTPDLLIDILRVLRAALPARVALSAKIRLLPSQEDTLKLVERIAGTGVAALTVHCRTRNQRMGEPAKIERLREIVHLVEGLGKNITVIANGDCQSLKDAKRVRDVTRASCSFSRPRTATDVLSVWTRTRLRS
jgi:tRNA-dihydrouridine synthase 2